MLVLPQQGWVLLVMGVAGSGKTTIGRGLAAVLGVPFFDADDFHSPENIRKMARGEPLGDADRAPRDCANAAATSHPNRSRGAARRRSVVWMPPWS
jgi:gluconokinase